jgi:hypothetical protein
VALVGPHRGDRVVGARPAGPIGRLMEPLMKRQARQLARQSLGNFKWLVETGEAPPAKGPRLPVPATC